MTLHTGFNPAYFKHCQQIKLARQLLCQQASTLADIAVGAALAYLDFRFPHIAWREQHPNLLRLQEKLEKRPSFIDTAPVKA